MLTSLPSAFPGVEIKGPVNPVEVGGQVEGVCNGSGAPPPEIRPVDERWISSTNQAVHLMMIILFVDSYCTVCSVYSVVCAQLVIHVCSIHFT